MKRKGKGFSLMNGKRIDHGFDLTESLKQCFVTTALMQELNQIDQAL